jgi:hypothetical protein
MQFLGSVLIEKCNVSYVVCPFTTGSTDQATDETSTSNETENGSTSQSTSWKDAHKYYAFPETL